MTTRTPLSPEESHRAAQELIDDIRRWLKEKQAEAERVRSQFAAHWVGTPDK